MDYKEKLKEALNSDNTDYEVVRWIEQNFPELKESEDEKWIPKEIANYLKEKGDFRSCWIAWLEKQGKKEWSKEMGSLCLEACSLLRDYLEGVPSNSPLAQKIKRAEAFLGDLYHEEFFPNTYSPRPDIISPEWSDKDETIIKTMCNEGNLKPSEIRWLNNLCYRVKQQKPAWSEEDERIYQSIMDDTVQENQLDGKQIDWLRDIKYRHFSQPQNTWKPSEEQVKALEYYIRNVIDKEGVFGRKLAELYEDLWNLREE